VIGSENWSDGLASFWVTMEEKKDHPCQNKPLQSKQKRVKVYIASLPTVDRQNPADDLEWFN